VATDEVFDDGISAATAEGFVLFRAARLIGEAFHGDEKPLIAALIGHHLVKRLLAVGSQLIAVEFRC
jgi:hypothetical protein